MARTNHAKNKHSQFNETTCRRGQNSSGNPRLPRLRAQGSFTRTAVVKTVTPIFQLSVKIPQLPPKTANQPQNTLCKGDEKWFFFVVFPNLLPCVFMQSFYTISIISRSTYSANDAWKFQQNTLDRVNSEALLLNTSLPSSSVTIQTPLFLRTLNFSGTDIGNREFKSPEKLPVCY